MNDTPFTFDRMAFLNHFTTCRWTLDQVRTGMTDQYTGLTALYETKTDRLLPVEWAKAQAFTATVKGPSARTRETTAHNYHTSPTSLTGGST